MEEVLKQPEQEIKLMFPQSNNLQDGERGGGGGREGGNKVNIDL